MDALPLKEWLELAHNTPGVMLTLGDILDMKAGEVKHFLCIDRNFYDGIHNGLSDRPELKQENLKDPANGVPAKELFTHNYHIIFRKADHPGPVGKWIHKWTITDDEDEQAVEDLRALEIEYAPDCWYPLETNGKIEVDPVELAIFGPRLKAVNGKHYDEFPRSTRVGWRGPAVLYEWMETSPNIIYKPSD
jgi:hypothetical protein